MWWWLSDREGNVKLPDRKHNAKLLSDRTSDRECNAQNKLKKTITCNNAPEAAEVLSQNPEVPRAAVIVGHSLS